MRTLSRERARRMALGAQGFADPVPTGAVDRRHGRRVLDRVGLIQIDSVNVLCRSQELPLLARLEPHRRDLISHMTAAGDLFEYWGHEASHLPVRLHPLMRWRMADAAGGRGVWGNVARIARERPDLVARVMDQVAAEGPLAAGDLDDPGARTEGMWGRTPAKLAIEHLFWCGRVTARRGPNFERRYDLPERMLPASVLDAPTPGRVEAQEELLVLAARHQGVGTARDLADHFRLHIPTARVLLAGLVDRGRLLPVEVEGWRDPAFMHPDARTPREIRGRALLSPFDSLIWERARTERIWGFRHRLEIYVPAARRRYGYYVLPFLLDGHLVARVDLKADRGAGVLIVRSTHIEDDLDRRGQDRDRVCRELADALSELGVHLGLGEVVVEPVGGSAIRLAGAVRDLSGRGVRSGGS